MKIDSTLSLPHPVYGLPENFNENYAFEVVPKVYSAGDALVLELDSLLIENEYINSLFQNEVVVLILKIVCPATFYSNTIKMDKITKFQIPLKELQTLVKLQFFLVADSDYENYSDNSFHPDYFLDNEEQSFKLDRKSIVGVLPAITIPLKESFRKGAASMFEFRRADEFTPLGYDVDGQGIEITYPYKENELDLLRVLSQKSPRVFFNVIIVPALTEAFRKLQSQEDLETFCDKHEWARIIHGLYPGFEQTDHVSAAQMFMKLLMSEKYNDDLPILQSITELN